MLLTSYNLEVMMKHALLEIINMYFTLTHDTAWAVTPSRKSLSVITVNVTVNACIMHYKTTVFIV